MNYNIKASKSAYIEFDGTQEQSSKYGLSEAGEWATEFSYGVITGVASCNSTEGDSFWVGAFPDDGYIYSCDAKPENTFTSSVTGVNCWCRVTSFVPVDGLKQSVSKSVWVNLENYNHNCSNSCAYQCTRAMIESDADDFRRAIFGDVSTDSYGESCE